VQVIVAHPTPKDGIANYIGQASETGLVIVVVIAASAFTFDARRGLSTFFRTRASSMWQLIAPRFAASAAVAVAAYTLGTLAAWYETVLLLGQPPAGAMLTGLLCGSVFLHLRCLGRRHRRIPGTQHAGRRRCDARRPARPAAARPCRAAAYMAAQHPAHSPRRAARHGSLGDYLPALGSAVAGSALLLAVATSRLGGREV
jgi:hypothetical protein